MTLTFQSGGQGLIFVEWQSSLTPVQGSHTRAKLPTGRMKLRSDLSTSTCTQLVLYIMRIDNEFGHWWLERWLKLWDFYATGIPEVHHWTQGRTKSQQQNEAFMMVYIARQQLSRENECLTEIAYDERLCIIQNAHKVRKRLNGGFVGCRLVILSETCRWHRSV